MVCLLRPSDSRTRKAGVLSVTSATGGTGETMKPSWLSQHRPAPTSDTSCTQQFSEKFPQRGSGFLFSSLRGYSPRPLWTHVSLHLALRERERQAPTRSHPPPLRKDLRGKRFPSHLAGLGLAVESLVCRFLGEVAPGGREPGVGHPFKGAR